MENKRMTKKLNSWFWWVLMALPLILLIITYIVAIPQYAKNFDWNNSEWYEFIDYSLNSSYIFDNAFNQFDNMSIIHIFNDVLDTLNVGNNYLGYLLNWCASVYLYHLIFDCVVFIFDWLHDFFERG